MKSNENIHNCPLRKKNIDDGECFETVMAILGMHSIEVKKKIYNVYPNCEKICEKWWHVIKGYVIIKVVHIGESIIGFNCV